MVSIKISNLELISTLSLDQEILTGLSSQEQEKIRGGFITGGDIGGGIAAGVAAAVGVGIAGAVAAGLAGIVVGNVIQKMIETGTSGGVPIADISDIIGA